jgi:hypothetical protein
VRGTCSCARTAKAFCSPPFSRVTLPSGQKRRLVLGGTQWSRFSQGSEDGTVLTQCQDVIWRVARFEGRSEDAKHPIQDVLRDQQSGRASQYGEQTIRVTFASPQTISRSAIVSRRIMPAALGSSPSHGLLQESNWREIVRRKIQC